jgi:4-hydroxyphenylpyruvate dioxygenase-like putative hemolysin
MIYADESHKFKLIWSKTREGLQHLALKTDDIFETLTLMREARRDFDSNEDRAIEYYRELPERLGDKLTVSAVVHRYRYLFGSAPK